MKYTGDQLTRLTVKVAPCAGAWIEIERVLTLAEEKWSPPARGRGLKLTLLGQRAGCRWVAPCAGAWIEIP